MARQGSQQNSDKPAPLFNYDAFADLRGLGWDSVKGLIEAATIDVPPECRKIVVRDPRALLTSFTQNPAVAQWIPELAQQGVTFERFIHEIFCNMDTCSGSCIQSGAMNFICLSYDYFALLDLISCPDLFSDSSRQYYV